jgi:hypothetical protein
MTCNFAIRRAPSTRLKALRLSDNPESGQRISTRRADLAASFLETDLGEVTHP